METPAPLQQSVVRYRQINQLSLEIEQAVLHNRLDDIADLCELMDLTQDQAKGEDAHLSSLFLNHPELIEESAAQEWLSLMEMIHARNQQLLPRINSILALHRSELQTLRRGSSLLQGYRPTTVHTGRRLSSSG
jgi:hypothetical protein